MLWSNKLIIFGSVAVQAAAIASTASSATVLLPVHPISRVPGISFENLAVRANSQILSTTAHPNASIYQFDPLSKLPPTIIHTVPNVTSCLGIVEGAPDVFYVACGDANLKDPTQTTPASYNIWELHVRGVAVLPNGDLTRAPVVKHVANLPSAALMNGIALARPHGKHLLVADTYRGLIWNVDTCNGEVGIALNDSSTRGPGSSPAGVNGLKVFDGVIYYDNTGGSTLWKVPIGEDGIVEPGTAPSMLAKNVSCDDLIVAGDGTVFVAGPYNIVTRVDTEGHTEIIAGVFNSTDSPLKGPTALRFGRRRADRNSLYVTSNGGLYTPDPSGCGLSSIDLGEEFTSSRR